MRGHTKDDQYHAECSHVALCAGEGTARSMRRRLTLAMVAAVLTCAPAACAYKGLTMAEQTAFALHGDGTLTDSNGVTAVTYNPALAPPGARMKVSMIPSGENTVAELTVSGLQPNRGYAVIAHVNACGGVPGGEGPHYQNRIDPA